MDNHNEGIIWKTIHLEATNKIVANTAQKK